jgi:hypothetical protein
MIRVVDELPRLLAAMMPMIAMTMTAPPAIHIHDGTLVVVFVVVVVVEVSPVADLGSVAVEFDVAGPVLVDGPVVVEVVFELEEPAVPVLCA